MIVYVVVFAEENHTKRVGVRALLLSCVQYDIRPRTHSSALFAIDFYGPHMHENINNEE